MFCFWTVFLVFRMCINWARVTLNSRITSLVQVTFFLMATLSHCGCSGPLLFQNHRQELLGHSFLLNLWGLSCVDVCFCVSCSYAHLINRVISRVLWLFIKFCKCVLTPPVDPFSLDCQIDVCKMQAFKVLFISFI